ncbi:MAG: dTDP-4-dehydrorhamnose 3,5-epimerase family protein [Patescibacteria group bacterium]|jgi:dTDP-4-dehydrorhamnose 3,5-epimerase
MIDGVVIKKITRYNDNRGWLGEIYRSDEFDFKPAMSYISVTNPGVVRGPHEHRAQADLFVFVGPGSFRLHLWDNRKDSQTYGEKYEEEFGENNPAAVIVPAGVVHGYKCSSAIAGWVINMPDKLYKGEGKKEDIDEIRWEQDVNSPFKI